MGSYRDGLSCERAIDGTIGFSRSPARQMRPARQTFPGSAHLIVQRRRQATLKRQLRPDTWPVRKMLHAVPVASPG